MNRFRAVRLAVVIALGALSNGAASAQQAGGAAAGGLLVPESTVIGGAGAVKAAPSAPAPDSATSAANDYPTVARADYVFACMQVNGQTRDVLEKCSCSIDVIASLLPFAEYEEAETVMSIRQRGGKAIGIWEHGPAKEKVKTMKRAQIEGELRCF